jgi:hypothetical protein
MLKRRTDFGSQEGDRLRLSDEDWASAKWAAANYTQLGRNSCFSP